MTSRWLQAAFSAALALPLFVYASIGGYSRYTADDFCWAGILRTEGFFNAQVHYYTIYSPRYAFTFLVNLTELIGPSIVPALPAGAIVVWLAVMTWTFTQFGLNSLRAFVFAEVGVLAALATAPDLPQSLYWQTGMLTYIFPLVLATFLIGWIRRGTLSTWSLLVCGLVTFFAGGLSETYLIPQNVAATLSLAVALLARERRAPLFAAAVVGGVLALVAITVAPATANRVGGTPADLWLTLSASIATAYAQLFRLVRFFPQIVVLCVAVPALLAGCVKPISARRLLAITAVVLITLPFCYFPSFYAQNGNPPTRSLIVPGAILVGYAMLLGFRLSQALALSPDDRGASLRKRLRWFPPRRLAVTQALAPDTRGPAPRVAQALALVALALVPLGVALVTLPGQAKAAQYAALFDAEDRQIRATRDAGATDLVVPPLPPNFGEKFVGPDPDDWFNMCVARYYGVSSIAAPAS